MIVTLASIMNDILSFIRIKVSLPKAHPHPGFDGGKLAIICSYISVPNSWWRNNLKGGRSHTITWSLDLAMLGIKTMG